MMEKGLKISWSGWIFGLLAIGAMVLMSYKAATTSFTHDESLSFNNYIDWSFIDIISFRQGFTNLHILNSLGMKYCHLLFGDSELSLRLPNLLALGIYLCYGYLLFRRQGRVLALGMFVLLLANHVLLDLFGVARGYGLSFGFMLMSLYHFIQSIDSQQTKHLVLFHLAGFLAILSNFVMLDVYVALLLQYNVLLLIDRWRFSKQPFRFWARNKVHIIAIPIVAGLLYEPLRRLTKYSQLDFGGKSGFYDDTVASVIETAFHGTAFPGPWGLAMRILLTAIVLASTVVIVGKIYQSDQAFFKDHKGFIVTNFLLLTMTAMLLLQHQFTKADFPVGRFAVFIFVLYLVHFGYMLGFMGEKFQKAVPAAALGLSIFAAVSYARHLDMHACSVWVDDSKTKAMLETIAESRLLAPPATDSLQLGISWFFEPTINFYRRSHHLDWLAAVDRNGVSEADDYYYVFDQDLDSLPRAQCTVVAHYDAIMTTLLRHDR